MPGNEESSLFDVLPAPMGRPELSHPGLLAMQGGKLDGAIAGLLGLLGLLGLGWLPEEEEASGATVGSPGRGTSSPVALKKQAQLST